MPTEMRQVSPKYLGSMGTNKTNSVIAGAFLSALLFLQATCTKTSLDYANTKYSFLLPVKAYPNKETISVGDTIWLEINESTSFTDHQNGQTINYSGAQNLGSAVSFSYRDTLLNQWVDAVDRFEYLLAEGKELKRTPLDIQYQFSEVDGRYVFRLGVIPKRMGLHSLLFSSSNNTYRNQDKCTKASFIINFKNTDQHYRLSPSYTGQTGLVGGDYYFVVK